jgi:RIO-like serine/threonine protein kinase
MTKQLEFESTLLVDDNEVAVVVYADIIERDWSIGWMNDDATINEVNAYIGIGKNQKIVPVSTALFSNRTIDAFRAEALEKYAKRKTDKQALAEYQHERSQYYGA